MSTSHPGRPLPCCRVAAYLRPSAASSWPPAHQRRAPAAKGRKKRGASLWQQASLMTLQMRGGWARPPAWTEAQPAAGSARAWPATWRTTQPTKCPPCILRRAGGKAAEHAMDACALAGMDDSGWPAGRAMPPATRAALAPHPDACLQVTDRGGAPLGLDALLAALPRLREAAESGREHATVTQEVRLRGCCSLLCCCCGPSHLLAPPSGARGCPPSGLLPRRLPTSAHRQPRAQDHPLLHRPFYLLHPCQTEATMQLLAPRPPAAAAPEAAAAAAAGEEASPAGEPAPAAEAATAAAAAGWACRYLLAWLSVVGQPLGLRLAPSLFQQQQAQQQRAQEPP